MAHQAHNIPWNSLASNLKYVHQHANARGQGSVPDPADRRTDLFLIENGGTDKAFVIFIKGFMKTLDEFVESERLKYPSTSDLQPFSDDEDVFDQQTRAAIRKASIDHEIPKMISYLNQPGKQVVMDPEAEAAALGADQNEIPAYIAAAVPDWSSYIIDMENRDLNRWLGWVKAPDDSSKARTLKTYSGQAPEHWGGYKLMTSEQERGDVVALCIYENQILPLLQLAKSPYQDLQKLVSINGYSQMFNRPSGLMTVLQMALSSYIVLNILYCKPELYTAAATERGPRDYRLCYCYRAMVANCTCEDDHDYWAIPHRAFWGRGRYFLPGIDNRREKPILKNGVEVDPLGDGHAQELKAYLRDCWNWIIRCIVVGCEWGVELNPEIEILSIFVHMKLITWDDLQAISDREDWKERFKPC